MLGLVRALPRSTSPDPGRVGTLRDCIARLPYVAELGFDVLYLPPIHPIGVTNRKGPDNATVARPGDPGSPWAIGNPHGGHTAIEPALGTLADFTALRREAEAHGIELALDLAFQCSPDHPWVVEHPGWFAHRSDGSIKYAENPPKRYEDVLPLDYGNPDWRALWDACLDVVRTWIGRGVRIFRVDNPHTKPFAFWEWLLAEVARTDPDVLFLAEAFTRPAVMEQLAKIGFHQSYTYFTWRETRYEIEEYFTELTQGPATRVLPPERVAEHPRHPAGAPAARSARDVRDPPRARGRPRRQLRDLRSGVRARAARAARRRAPRSTSTPRSTRCTTGTSTRGTACATSSRA